MGADDSDLQQKLASESRTNGLALAAAIGDEILVIPFDGPERHFQAEHRFSILTVGKSGQIVSWWFREQDFFTTERFRQTHCILGWPRLCH